MCYVYAIVRGMSKRCLGMECYCLDVSEVCHAFSFRELHRFEPPMQVTNFLLTQKDMSSGRNGGAFHDCSNSSVGAYTAPWVSCSRQTHRNNPKVGSRSALECTHCVAMCLYIAARQHVPHAPRFVYDNSHALYSAGHTSRRPRTWPRKACAFPRYLENSQAIFMPLGALGGMTVRWYTGWVLWGLFLREGRPARAWDRATDVFQPNRSR